jgi:hypothetical protein
MPVLSQDISFHVNPSERRDSERREGAVASRIFTTSPTVYDLSFGGFYGLDFDDTGFIA